MEISAESVKELRLKTGAGMMACKEALKQANGDLALAIEYLRKQGLSVAEKKAKRLAAEGVVSSYIHGNGRIGVLVEVNCETDFVARTPEFQSLVKDIAMQIAAMNPQCVSVDDLPKELVEAKRKQLVEQGHDQESVDRMFDEYLKDACLLSQPFVKDASKTIDQLLKEQIARMGEKIVVRRFVRYELGEGLEKKQTNFAEEVRSQLQGS
jgi:elongation factor Ts